MAGYIFTQGEAERVAAAVKANEGRPPHQLPPRKRPFRGGGGGGGSSCTTQFAIWFSNRPTGGSTSVPLTVAGVTESVTIDWDCDDLAPDMYGGSASAYLDTALAAHSEIAQADVTVTTPGGTLPHHVLRFYFSGDTGAKDIVIGNQTDSFTGGSSPYSTIDKCCG